MMLPIFVAITRDHFYPLPYNDGKTKVPVCSDSVGSFCTMSQRGTKKRKVKTVKKAGSVFFKFLDFIFYCHCLGIIFTSYR